MREELSDDSDSLGCTYATPHDISRPSVLFFRNTRWRSLTNFMGKSASAKSQMALMAVLYLAFLGRIDTGGLSKPFA